MTRFPDGRVPFLRITLYVIIGFFGSAPPAPAQSGTGKPIDANVCFADLLRNQYDFSQHTDIKYRLFSLWNKDLYEDSKMNSSMLTVYGEGSLDASQSKILREMQMNNESIDYDRATAIHVATLDPAAAQIINHCLDTLTSGFGIHTKVEIEDERYLDLTIYWSSPTGSPLKFKKQEIFNGNVLDDKKSHPTVPLVTTETGAFSRWYDAAIPSGSSRTIKVERTGPYQRVTFKFVTSPDISFEPIIVEPVPEKVIYIKHQLIKNPITDQRLHKEWPAQTWVNNNGLVQTWDDGHAHKHYTMTHSITEIEQDPTAVFTVVRCEKYGGPADFADLDGANPPWAGAADGQGVGTRQAVCSGWWQETGRGMRMLVDYQVTGFEPQKQTWKGWY